MTSTLTTDSLQGWARCALAGVVAAKVKQTSHPKRAKYKKGK